MKYNFDDNNIFFEGKVVRSFWTLDILKMFVKHKTVFTGKNCDKFSKVLCDNFAW